MARNHRRGVSLVNVIAIVITVPLLAGAVALVGWWWYTQRDPEAAPLPPLFPEISSAVQTSDKLAVTVRLGNDYPSPRYFGPLRAEVVGPDGTVLAQGEMQVSPKEWRGSHRFEFPAIHLPAEKVTIRCTYQVQKVEVPLSSVLPVKAGETNQALQ